MDDADNKINNHFRNLKGRDSIHKMNSTEILQNTKPLPGIVSNITCNDIANLISEDESDNGDLISEDDSDYGWEISEDESDCRNVPESTEDEDSQHPQSNSNLQPDSKAEQDSLVPESVDELDRARNKKNKINFIHKNILINSSEPTTDPPHIFKRTLIYTQINNRNNIKWYSVGVIILAVLLAVLIKIYISNSTAGFLTLNQDIMKTAKIFSKQNQDIWSHFEIGVQEVIDNKYPAVYLLLENSKKTETALRISQSIGNITVKHLLNSTENIDAVVLTPNILNTLRRGEIILKYKDDLASHFVMIVLNIEHLKPIIAQDLRYICDVDDPCVKRSVIFLTMDVSGCQNSEKIIHESTRNNTKIVEDCLTNLWGGPEGLTSVVIKPLLSRIVNVILLINKED